MGLIKVKKFVSMAEKASWYLEYGIWLDQLRKLNATMTVDERRAAAKIVSEFARNDPELKDSGFWGKILDILQPR